MGPRPAAAWRRASAPDPFRRIGRRTDRPKSPARALPAVEWLSSRQVASRASHEVCSPAAFAGRAALSGGATFRTIPLRRLLGSIFPMDRPCGFPPCDRECQLRKGPFHLVKAPNRAVTPAGLGSWLVRARRLRRIIHLALWRLLCVRDVPDPPPSGVHGLAGFLCQTPTVLASHKPGDAHGVCQILRSLAPARECSAHRPIQPTCRFVGGAPWSCACFSKGPAGHSSSGDPADHGPPTAAPGHSRRPAVPPDASVRPLLPWTSSSSRFSGRSVTRLHGCVVACRGKRNCSPRSHRSRIAGLMHQAMPSAHELWPSAIWACSWSVLRDRCLVHPAAHPLGGEILRSGGPTPPERRRSGRLPA